MFDDGASPFLPWLVEGALKLMIVPLALSALGLWKLRRKRRASEAWAVASGTVESAAVRYQGDSILTQRWLVDTTYSYRVNGDWHSGFATLRFGSEAEAGARASRLRHSSLMIRYNPNAPAESLPA